MLEAIVRILVDHLVGPVALTNRLKSAVYSRVSFNDLPLHFEYMLLYKWQHMFSRTMEHRLIFSALSALEPDVLWTINRAWRPTQLACTITWIYPPELSVLGTAIYFGVFRHDKWCRSVTATSWECLSEEYTGIFESVSSCMRRKAKSCFDMRGNRMEHLL
jgi:hypothetical protein